MPMNTSRALSKTTYWTLCVILCLKINACKLKFSEQVDSDPITYNQDQLKNIDPLV